MCEIQSGIGGWCDTGWIRHEECGVLLQIGDGILLCVKYGNDLACAPVYPEQGTVLRMEQAQRDESADRDNQRICRENPV